MPAVERARMAGFVRIVIGPLAACVSGSRMKIIESKRALVHDLDAPATYRRVYLDEPA